MARASKSVKDLRDEWNAKDGPIGVPEWRAFLIDALCERLKVKPTPDDVKWLDQLLVDVQIVGHLGPKF